MLKPDTLVGEYEISGRIRSMKKVYVIRAPGSHTIMRLACPMHRWGIFPSPAISLEVSTIQTLSCSAKIRATSRTMVVLPVIGVRQIEQGMHGEHGKVRVIFRHILPRENV